MQKEITAPGELLNEKGEIIQKGWARRPVLNYNRKNIRGSALFIKEWDYYYVTNTKYSLSLTMADNGYMAFYAMTLFDFTDPASPSEVSASIIRPFPLGRLELPATSLSGDCLVHDKKIDLAFLTTDEGKRLKIDYPEFNKGKGLKADLFLWRDKNHDSIMIATPFKKRGKFYFNEKVNCMPSGGKIETGGMVMEFEPETAMGVLDWGRGVWTYENTWYWGSASGLLEGKPFGFNIGYGFGDTSAATENVIFYEGRAHKLEDIQFHIPGEPEGSERYMEPWKFSSSDGRFELDFFPVLDRFSETSLAILKSHQHQVFGNFSGRLILDDGTPLEIKAFHGFAEKVFNRW
ncbi:MAG: DUF2804 domain-containing protein [Spirochaetales bacterium]|nr:DUF2804 domain-containing protein [Spirochaetales bacterium]